jgi:hypothetical protein
VLWKKVVIGAVLGWLLGFAGSCGCLAFEPRFYGMFPKNEDSKIFETAHQADRTLRCDSVDSIDIGLGVGDRHGITPLYFTREQIRNFLKEEKHKDLLVIWFHKGIMWRGKDDVQKALAEMKDFVADLGYKRVLILGAHSSGVFVVYDSSEKNHQDGEHRDK